jgi:hypothetical protein
MLLQNFIYFINSLNLLISKSFFYSQSNFSDVIKDISLIFFKKFKLNSDFFQSISGHSTTKLPNFNTEIATVRGNGNSINSMSYNLDSIDNIFKDIITEHELIIKKYLGNSFLYEPPLFFRNYNIPEEFQNYDIYSNVWHQDSHDGYVLLKVFILLTDIDESDGPFMFLERTDTKKYWKELRERWTFKKFKNIPTFKEEKKLTGKKGDYIIINTATCMHRASIPANLRDMAQITLYPNWRTNKGRKIYIFD